MAQINHIRLVGDLRVILTNPANTAIDIKTHVCNVVEAITKDGTTIVTALSLARGIHDPAVVFRANAGTGFSSEDLMRREHSGTWGYRLKSSCLVASVFQGRSSGVVHVDETFPHAREWRDWAGAKMIGYFMAVDALQESFDAAQLMVEAVAEQANLPEDKRTIDGKTAEQYLAAYQVSATQLCRVRNQLEAMEHRVFKALRDRSGRAGESTPGAPPP